MRLKAIRKKGALILSVLLVVIAAGAVIFLKTAYVIPILMYHSIGYDDKVMKTTVSPGSFERQMEFLSKNHYNVIGLDKIISYIKNRERIPHRTVAITFDDGYYNNYQYAYPILKKYNLPATIFVIVDKIGLPGWLNWSQIEEMTSSGIITIGSHTKSHAWLPSLGSEELRRELTASKDILEKKLGRKVESLCYPLGAHDDRVKRAVKEAGYSCAVATNPKKPGPKDDLYSLRRVRISRTSDNLFIFWFETSGYYTWVKEHRDLA